MFTKNTLLKIIDNNIAADLKRRKWLEERKVWNCPHCEGYCIKKKAPSQCPSCHSEEEMIEGE